MFCLRNLHIFIRMLCLFFAAIMEPTLQPKEGIGDGVLNSYPKVNLKSQEIPYIHQAIWTSYEDVIILSLSGQRFGFNRCMLASVSRTLKELFLYLYECPLANLDDTIYVSSDYTSQELETLRNLLLSGALPEKSDHPSFQAIGLDLNNVLESFKESLSVNMVPKKDMVAEWKRNGKSDALESGSIIAAEKLIVKMEVEDLTPYPLLPLGDDGFFYDEKDFDSEDEPVKPIPAKRAKKTQPNSQPGPKPGPKAKRGPADDSKKKETFFFFPQDDERDFSRPYQCEMCVRGFVDEKEYRLHVHRHLLGEEDYSKAFACDSCEKFECGTQRGITEHRKKDCPIQKRNDSWSKYTYFCAICQPGQRFKTTKELLAHHQSLHKDLVALNVGVSVVHCPTCGIQLNNAHTLKKHFIKEGPFHKNSKCAFCPITFTTWTEHKEHLDKCHDGTFRYTCGFCGINHFRTHNEFQNHKTLCKINTAITAMEEYPDGKHISCTICLEKVAANIIDVRSHLKEAHAALGMPCNICREVYFNKRSLETHVKDTHMKNFACDQCDKVFGTGAKLRDHQKNHIAERNFVCNQCGKAFIRKHELRKHEQFTHEGIRTKSTSSNAIIHCEQCGEGIRECRYNYHKSHCHSKETFECTEPGCGMKFKSKRRLNNHTNQIHVYTTCDHCGKQCNKNQMKNHILTNHTADSDRPFVCNICHKGFSKRERYNNHMNIHTGNKPHICRYCTRNFADKANRNKHMRESHPAEYQMDKAKLQDK